MDVHCVFQGISWIQRRRHVISVIQLVRRVLELVRISVILVWKSIIQAIIILICLTKLEILELVTQHVQVNNTLTPPIPQTQNVPNAIQAAQMVALALPIKTALEYASMDGSNSRMELLLHVKTTELGRNPEYQKLFQMRQIPRSSIFGLFLEYQ